MANIVNNYSSTIITIYQDVIKAYERNLEVIKQTEDEINDLNHEIELSEPKDMYKGYLLYKEMKSRGLYLNFHNVKDLYSNIDAFNFIIECF